MCDVAFFASSSTRRSWGLDPIGSAGSRGARIIQQFRSERSLLQLSGRYNSRVKHGLARSARTRAWDRVRSPNSGSDDDSGDGMIPGPICNDRVVVWRTSVQALEVVSSRTHELRTRSGCELGRHHHRRGRDGHGHASLQQSRQLHGRPGIPCGGLASAGPRLHRRRRNGGPCRRRARQQDGVRLDSAHLHESRERARRRKRSPRPFAR